MKKQSYYTKSFVHTYDLRGRLWKGMTSLLGWRRLYLSTAQSLSRRTVREALLSDLLSIRQDSRKALLERGVTSPRAMNKVPGRPAAHK